MYFLAAQYKIFSEQQYKIFGKQYKIFSEQYKIFSEQYKIFGKQYKTKLVQNF